MAFQSLFPGSAARAHSRQLAMSLLGREAEQSAEVRLESPAFAPGGEIPVRFTADGRGESPPLRWSGVPEGTRSLVVLCEDPDAPMPQPFVHWLLYDLSPRLGGLPPGLADAPELPGGGRSGQTSASPTGWVPCAPPSHDPAHHYHFELFALDAPLPLGLHADRAAVLEAMRGHVLGHGELMGTYQR